MSKPCGVEWCAMLAKPGEPHCAVHSLHPKLQPVELAPDEEMVDDGCADCDECDGDGMVKCDHCHGHGDVEYVCTECHSDSHSHECHACDGEGEASCQACGGTGSASVRKKSATEAA